MAEVRTARGEPANREKIVILVGHPNWAKFEGISINDVANALFLSGHAALMEKILHIAIVGNERIEPADVNVAESRSPESEKPPGRAGSTGNKYNDRRKHTAFGGNILEYLGVAPGTTKNEDPQDESSPDVRSFFSNKSPYVFGSGKLNGLLSGIAEGARAGYVSAWKRWLQPTQRIHEKDGYRISDRNGMKP